MINEQYQPKPKPLLPLLLACLAVAFYSVWLCYRSPLESLIAWTGPEAKYRLGNCYYDGFTTERDYAKAAKWYRLAAAQGHLKAQAALGMMYLHGTGVARDYQIALRLLNQAAKQHAGTAENQLGLMYAQGKGVPQDLDLAANWFTKAANHGCQAARHNLKLLAATRPSYLPSLTLPNGTTYRFVNVRKVELDGVTITYQPCRGGCGISKLPFRDLPVEFREKCGLPESAPIHLASSAQLAVVNVGMM